MSKSLICLAGQLKAKSLIASSKCNEPRDPQSPQHRGPSQPDVWARMSRIAFWKNSCYFSLRRTSPMDRMRIIVVSAKSASPKFRFSLNTNARNLNNKMRNQRKGCLLKYGQHEPVRHFICLIKTQFLSFSISQFFAANCSFTFGMDSNSLFNHSWRKSLIFST